MSEYDFDTQLRRGEESEQWIAEWLRQNGHRVTAGGGRFDLIVNGKGVDVKRDEIAERTGRLVIETVSHQTQLGWAYTMKEEYILNHLPHT